MREKQIIDAIREGHEPGSIDGANLALKVDIDGVATTLITELAYHNWLVTLQQAEASMDASQMHSICASADPLACVLVKLVHDIVPWEGYMPDPYDYQDTICWLMTHGANTPELHRLLEIFASGGEESQTVVARFRQIMESCTETTESASRDESTSTGIEHDLPGSVHLPPAGSGQIIT